jgi:antitoxin (DNA-binding transcriptional repressor) of toxin-antitoxin stability system
MMESHKIYTTLPLKYAQLAMVESGATASICVDGHIVARLIALTYSNACTLVTKR